MSDINPLFQWLNAHPNLAGLATFFISAIESIAIIGTIIPGSVMMTAIGTLAGAGVIPLGSTIIWAILGAIVGDGISYWIGYYFKDRLHQVWPFKQHPSLLERGEKFFILHGGKSVFFGRFVGPVRAMVPLVAGMLRMPPMRFTIANVLSAIGWAPAYMLPGILLGAASLELPPDIAVHVILMLLLLTLFIILCIWLIKKTFSLIDTQVKQFLTRFWQYLDGSRYFHTVTQLLRHQDHSKTYGQLVLAFYLLLSITLLLCLSTYIWLIGNSASIAINDVFFHLFRSLRTPSTNEVMLALTFLGDKFVVIPVLIALFAWLAFKRNWNTAIHVIALTFITAGSLFALKFLVHSHRPWGLLNAPHSYSFPSGHTTWAVVFITSMVLLVIKMFSIKRRTLLYTFSGTLILLVSISRMYLGVHWFTDILGGWLLGATIVMLITLSYNRRTERPLNPFGILLVLIVTLSITYSIVLNRHFIQYKRDYESLPWPSTVISLPEWWNQTGKDLPLFRINRFGLSREILNLQWAGDLNQIRKSLLANGWTAPNPVDWINVLYRIADVQSTEHLPLVSPLYLNQKPELVLIKKTNGSKKLVALRLWESKFILENYSHPLWVGSVEIVPRTYSWLFKSKPNGIMLSKDLIFDKHLSLFDIKTVLVHINKKHYAPEMPILLIKPKQ